MTVVLIALVFLAACHVYWSWRQDKMSSWVVVRARGSVYGTNTQMTVSDGIKEWDVQMWAYAWIHRPSGKAVGWIESDKYDRLIAHYLKTF